MFPDYIDKSLLPSSERMKEMRDIALEQYTACARVLNEIFRLCPDPEWQIDGIGSCQYDGSQDDLRGGVIGDWESLRHEVRDRFFPLPLEHHNIACSYHAPDSGCVLGELKSPICLGYISAENLPDSFSALGNIRIFLSDILNGGRHRRSIDGTLGNPEANWPRVREFLEKADGVLHEIRAKNSKI